VEQYSDLVCNEIQLILSTTNSVSLTLEFISKGDYPVISSLMKDYLKELNLGSKDITLFQKLAKNQPSKEIAAFVESYIIPYLLGEISNSNLYMRDFQWRMRNKFEAYLSQLEGKMSIFLAFTTIIPITISLLLVVFGYMSISLVVFLPLLFFIFDLVAFELLKSGKIDLLGG
jgi:hypothetical protein